MSVAHEGERSQAPSLTRATALMTLGTIVSRATGVIRLAVIAAVLGVAESRLPDTYNLANTAPNILYELVLGGVITSIFVPLFVELLEKEERDEAVRVMSGILNVSLLGLAVLAVLGVIAAPAIAALFAGRLSGPDAELQRDAITFLLRLFIPQVVLYGLYFVTSAIMNAHKRFGPPMFTPIVNNIVLIAVLLWFGAAYGAVTLENVTRTQLLVIGLGTTLSVAPMGLLLIPYLRRLGVYRATLSTEHPAFRKLLRLSVFAVGFVVANQLGFVIIQWLANEQQGAYSAYTSAFTFFLLPVGLFVWSLTTAIVPNLSEHATNERWSAFRTQLSGGLRGTLFLMVPAAVGYALLARPIVATLLEHGIVTDRSVDLVSETLVALVLGLVQFSLFQVLVRAHYSLQDTRTPFLVNLGVIATIVALAVPLFEIHGVKGIAFAQAIAYTGGIFVEGAAIARRTRGIEGRSIAATTARVAVAAAVMGAVVWLVREMAENAAGSGDLAPLIVTLAGVIAGGATYLGMSLLLGIEEVAYLKRIVGRRAPA